MSLKKEQFPVGSDFVTFTKLNNYLAKHLDKENNLENYFNWKKLNSEDYDYLIEPLENLESEDKIIDAT